MVLILCDASIASLLWFISWVFPWWMLQNRQNLHFVSAVLCRGKVFCAKPEVVYGFPILIPGKTYKIGFCRLSPHLYKEFLGTHASHIFWEIAAEPYLIKSFCGTMFTHPLMVNPYEKSLWAHVGTFHRSCELLLWSRELFWYNPTGPRGLFLNKDLFSASSCVLCKIALSCLFSLWYISYETLQHSGSIKFFTTLFVPLRFSFCLFPTLFFVCFLFVFLTMTTRAASATEFKRVIQTILGYNDTSNVWLALKDDLGTDDFIDFCSLTDESIEKAVNLEQPQQQQMLQLSKCRWPRKRFGRYSAFSNTVSTILCCVLIGTQTGLFWIIPITGMISLPLWSLLSTVSDLSQALPRKQFPRHRMLHLHRCQTSRSMFQVTLSFQGSWPTGYNTVAHSVPLAPLREFRKSSSTTKLIPEHLSKLVRSNSRNSTTSHALYTQCSVVPSTFFVGAH